MRAKKEQTKPKQPIEMTNDELLDYTIAPEVAEPLKRLAKPVDPENEEDC
jgi:hypothetical protein